MGNNNDDKKGTEKSNNFGKTLEDYLRSTKLAGFIHNLKTGFKDQDQTEALNAEGKFLQNAFQAFSKNGVTADEKQKLKNIDDVFDHATIQLTKDSGAVITDDEGHTRKIRGR